MTTDPNSEIAKTIGLDAASARRKKLKRKIYWGLALLAVVLLLVKWNMDSGDAEIQFKTRPVKKGSITITVTATGNLTPTNQVEVGSELSGIVDTVDADFNDQVTVGQVLAKLDTSRLDAEVLQAWAMLASARAKVLQAKATVNESRNQLKRLEAVRELSNDRAVSQQDIETAQAIMDRAAADKASANAGVDQAKASLEAIETDLSKTVIRSPINGIVLARSVEPGQTVAASLQAPVLFTLAEDLTKMELNVDVDEADVAQVKEGQDADFTVDAYPDKTFPAKITQVRYGPKTVAGVVTYETILNVDNSDLLLRPGMTATADIIVNKIEDAILVPNAVLRFDPPEIEETADNSRRGVMRLFPSRKHPAKKRTELHPDRSHQLVWTQKNGELISIDVVTGESDGSMTEIKSGDVTPGMKLVVDMINTGK
jgi:HlyD family secretion protein